MNAISGIAEPLALGLSTGAYCVMYCAPVLLPFLCGREGLTHKKNLSLVGLFLGGRLAAYAVLGFALGAAGLLVTEFFDPVMARYLASIAYMICGIVLLAGGFGLRLVSACRTSCTAKSSADIAKKSDTVSSDPIRVRLVSFFTGDRMVALLSGLTVGLHICPPFWTAAVRSAASGNPVSGALYFLLFYIGTLPFFLPLLGIPFFSPRFPQLRKVARITQILVGVYFLILVGLIPFVFGR